RGFPGRIARVGFIRHPRIEKDVAAAELALEASDQLVIPCVVRSLACTLNEQNLLRHPTDLHASRETRSKARWLPDGGPSPQIGSKLAHAPAQAPAQERAQGRAVLVADLGGDGLDIELPAAEQGLRVIDAEVLEIGQRRFAEHGLATALQGA